MQLQLFASEPVFKEKAEDSVLDITPEDARFIRQNPLYPEVLAFLVLHVNQAEIWSNDTYDYLFLGRARGYLMPRGNGLYVWNAQGQRIVEDFAWRLFGGLDVRFDQGWQAIVPTIAKLPEAL